MKKVKLSEIIAEFNSLYKIYSEKLEIQDEFVTEQFNDYFTTFFILFVMKNLQKSQREKFLEIIDMKDISKIKSLLNLWIPNFEKKLTIAFQKELVLTLEKNGCFE